MCIKYHERLYMDDIRSVAIAQLRAGTAAVNQGDYATAQPLFEESLALFRRVGDNVGIAWTLNNLGEITAARGDHTQARFAVRSAQLAGAVEAATKELKAQLDRQYRVPREGAAAAMRLALGLEGFTSAFDAGKRLTIEEAVALALSPVT
jgi:ATP/maltotriose-dependent transcriptional regulator MalT